MQGGYRYLAGAVAGVLLVFAVWSIWPRIKIPSAVHAPAGKLVVTQQQAVKPAPVVGKPLPPTTPSLPSLGQPVAAHPQAPTPQLPPGRYHSQFLNRAQPGHPLAQALLAADETEPRAFKAPRAVILYVEPDGPPHTPPMVSHAPLTVLRGTTLREIKTEGEWMLVSCPARTLGWVPLADLEPIG